MVQGLRLVLFLLILAAPLPTFAGESSALTVTTVDARLYPRQDSESKFITTLDKGEQLQPLAHGVGNQDWYMVKTSKGIIGWVQGIDVSGGKRVAKTFRDTEKVKASLQQPTGFLSECFDRADEVHKKAWDKNCSINGRDCGSEGLPPAIADSLMRDRRAAR